MFNDCSTVRPDLSDDMVLATGGNRDQGEQGPGGTGIRGSWGVAQLRSWGVVEEQGSRGGGGSRGAGWTVNF